MSTTHHARAAGRLTVLCAAALLAAGCAGAGGAGGTAGGGAHAGAAAQAAGGGQFTPDKPQAARYGADPGRRCPRSEISRQVMDQLAQAAKGAGRPPPQEDGRVCAVAEALLAWDPAASGPPRFEVLEFISQWFGLPAAVQPPSFATFETEDAALIAERIVQATANAVVNAVYPRFAVADRHLGRGKTKVVVVLLDAPVEVDPLPRRLDPGQQATLSGHLKGGSKDPEVLVSDATGHLSKPEQAQGDAFKADLKCGDRPGRILVEIRGSYEGRQGIAAKFPVACGSELPGSVAVAPEAWPSDPAAAERKILEKVNAERTAAGLKPVEWDDGVAKVARAISEDIADRGGAAGGDVAERLKKEGIASALVLQSAVSDRSFDRAQDRLSSSPTNRANILNPEVTNLGVGAVSKQDAQGKPVVYVTEVYLKALPPVNVAKTRQDLKAAVAQKRKDARMSALTVDPVVDDVAQKYAEALAAAGGNLPKEKQAELTAPLNRHMKTLTILSGAKADPLDFAEEPQVTAVAKSVGIGVAQGAHPVLGRNAAYVVIMVGTPRSEAAGAGAVKGSRKAPAKKKTTTTTR